MSLVKTACILLHIRVVRRTPYYTESEFLSWVLGAHLCNAMADKKRIQLNDNTTNALGFKVHTPGIDLSRFIKNPVMLHLHDMTKLLGKVNDLTVDGDTLTGEPEFNSKNPFAAEKEQEFNDGFLNACSLGLMQPFTFSKGADMDAVFGYADDDIVLAGCVLFELTLCPVPQNENALVLYKTDGLKLAVDEIKQITLSLTTPTHKPTPTNMLNKLICLALGLPDTSSDDVITLGVSNLKAENARLKATNDTLQAKQDALEVEKVGAMVQLAIDSKKITADQKDLYVKLAKADFDGVKAILDGMTPVINLAAATGGAAADATTAAAKATSRKDWTFNDYSQKAPEELKLMKETQTAQFNELFKAQFGEYPKS